MSRPGRSFMSFALTLALGLTAAGCGKFREVSACRGLVREVNPVLEQIEKLSASSAPDRELQMAQHYSSLAKRLAPRGVGQTPLAGAVRDYAVILSAADAALRSHAEASKSNNAARMVETRRELERLVKRERTAVARISVECHV